MKEKIILGLYLDDVLIVGDELEVKTFIESFKNKYKSRVYDSVDNFIGCELMWNANRTRVILHQSGMIKKLRVKVEKYLNKYNIRKRNIPMTKGHCVRQLREDEIPMTDGMQRVYRSCVGSLLYIVKHSRPDLCNTVRELSKVNRLGKLEDFISMLQCGSFLFATKDLGVQMERKTGDWKWNLYGFSDSDWGNDLDNRRSITGIAVFVNGNLIH